VRTIFIIKTITPVSIFLNSHDLQVVDEMEINYLPGFSPKIQKNSGLKL